MNDLVTSEFAMRLALIDLHNGVIKALDLDLAGNVWRVSFTNEDLRARHQRERLRIERAKPDG